MANTLRFKRGLVSTIPTALAGEPLFTTDTFDLYIGNGTTNTRFQKYIASGTTSQLLRGDGSLLTMPIVLTSPSTGQVLKFNGTNWVNDSDAGITGSGTTNYLPKFTGASTLGNSNVIDTGSLITLGSNTNITGITQSTASNIPFRSIVTSSEMYNAYLVNTSTLVGYIGNGDGIITNGGTNNFGIRAEANLILAAGGNNRRATIFSNGNFVVNSSTDNGLRFQVTGDGFFSGSVGVGTTAITDVNLYIRKNLSGSVFPSGFYIDSTVQSTATTGASYYTTSVSTQAAAFTLPNLFHYRATQGTIGAGSTVTNQYGYIVEASLIGATNNYGFYGNIASGTGRWNLYMNGSAANYLAGQLLIGTTTTSSVGLDVRNGVNLYTSGASANSHYLELVSTTSTDGYVNFRRNGGANGPAAYYLSNGNARFSYNAATGDTILGAYVNSPLLFFTNSTERMRLDASGNLGLGVVPSAWASVNALQMGFVGSLAARSGGSGIYLSSNAYFIGDPGANGANARYIQTTTAGSYSVIGNNHYWFTAPSGTLNTAITWTQPMTLFSTGNLAVGTTTDAGFRLDVNGTMRVSGASTFGSFITVTRNQDANVTTFNATAGVTPVSAFVINTDQPNLRAVLTSRNGYSLALGTNDTNRLTIDTTGAATFSSSVTATGLFSTGASNFATSSGNVGIGTASPGYKLHVQTSGASGTSFGLRVQAGTNSSDAAMQILSQAGSTYLFLRGDNNLGFGTSLVGATGTNTMSVFNGTAPTTNVTDSFQMYSNDIVAGNAAPHFRTENGAIIKLYQETTGVGNSIISLGGGNAVLDDTTFDGYTLRQIVKALRNQGILQ